MSEIINFLENYWSGIVFAFLSFLFGLLTSYLKQRAKNKALIADNKRLEEEKQQIKKKHQLDIEKRKYKYEHKQEQFKKYFNLLDDLSIKSSKEVELKFSPIYTEYIEEYLADPNDSQKQAKAVAKFTAGLKELMSDANVHLIKIRGETNGIRIIADTETIKLLDEIEKLYEIYFNLTSQLIQKLPSVILKNNPDEISIIQNSLEDEGKKILDIKNKMIEQVRKELDEI